MNISGHAALVTGGASGLGEATARELARLGAKVAILDVNMTLAEAVTNDIGGVACQCDITNTESVTAAINKAREAHGSARMLMNIAGVGGAKRIVQKDGSAAPLEDFARVVNINLIGLLRHAIVRSSVRSALADGRQRARRDHVHRLGRSL